MSRVGWRRHAVALAPLLIAALWVMRNFLLSSAIPAGSDMFGFVARARENAPWAHMVSVWAPSYYGAPRQYTLDFVLGLTNHLTGNPVATVKLLAFCTLLGAGAFAYLLTYRWYGSTWVASVAGLLYMTSQQSLSRWGTGQLNHEIGFALAPLLIYLVARCVDEFTVARAIGVALALNAELLVRPDVVLWVAPFLALYPLIRSIVRKEGRRTIATVVRLCVVIVPATVALNLMQILPLLAGVRATWVSLGGLYGVHDLIDRSLDAYPSLLGFGREIGYIGFTGQQTWYFHPWVANWIYFAAATMIVALAFAALWRHRDHRTIYLAASALTAAFLAKSVKGPIGGPYLWVAKHVPIVPNLRDPNRYLFVQALAYAVLGSLTLRLMVERLHSKWGARRAQFRASCALVFALILLPVGPTLLTGLRTWRPESGQIALLKAIEADHGAFTVATVPYDQTGRFLVQGDYKGWEHDLGGDSSAFTGHPSISDGGWSQRSQDFVAFTSGLLKNHDPAFQEILGATGTKYLVRFVYPASQPHLVRKGIPPFWQHQAIDSIPGFVPQATNEQGTVYRLDSWSPLASFRPNLALVLGGPSGIASLADLPGVNLQNWAAITAPEALSIGGLPELMQVLSESRLIVLSNETVQDLAVLATHALAQIPGITSDPAFDRVGQQVGSDASSRQGSLADQALPVAASRTLKAQGSFMAQQPQEVEIWTRIKSFPNAGQMAFTLDGIPVRTLTPVSPFEGGLRWVLVYRGSVGPGRHSVAMQALRSRFGGAFELDETRVIDPTERASAQQQIESGLSRFTNKLVYTYDLQDVEKWIDGFDPSGSREAVGGIGEPPRNRSERQNRHASFWQILDPAHVEVVGKPSSTPVARFQVRPGRQYYAFVNHRFSVPQNWSGKPFIFLTVDGTGSGESYDFVVDFGTGQAFWPFRDDTTGLRTLSFTPAVAQSRGPIDWSHVVSVKVSARSKNVTGSIGLGPVEISASGSIALSLPILPSPQARTAVLEQTANQIANVAGLSPVHVEPGTRAIRLTVPYSDLSGGKRVVLLPSERISEIPAAPLRIQQSGVGTYGVEFQASHPGVLMFEQGYDPKWRAEIAGVQSAPLPMFSVMDGFLVSPGTGGTSGGSASSTGSVSYTGQRAASAGLFLSGVSWVVLGVIALPFAAWAGRRRGFLGNGFAPPANGLVLAVVVLVAIGAGALSARGWAHFQRQSVSYYWPQSLATDPLQFWTTPDDHVHLGKISGPDGQPAVGVGTSASRSFFTLLEHTFVGPQDWSTRRDVFLSFRGEGSGALYQLVVYTDDRHADSVSFAFRDIQPGWRVLTFDLAKPDHTGGRPDVSHVTAIRIGTSDLSVPGSLALGAIAVSQPGSR